MVSSVEQSCNKTTVAKESRVNIKSSMRVEMEADTHGGYALGDLVPGTPLLYGDKSEWWLGGFVSGAVRFCGGLARTGLLGCQRC